MGQQVNVYKKLKLFPGAVVEGAFGDSFDRGGKTYYVNNITGSSTNDGLSWNSAVDQLSTAVTLSEASRLIHNGTTTNDYIMNTIVIQGTGTTYTAVSALPSYCNVIGLGSVPFGNGAGIVTIGDATGAAHGVAGSTRGSNWSNIQFVGAGSYYAFSATVAYRSLFEFCAFGGNASSAACARGLSVTSGSGLVVRDCKTVMHAAFPVIGFCFAEAGGNFIDTANRYTEGTAEKFVGEFTASDRDHFVIATKYTLFMRRDEVEAAWQWIDPIQASWEENRHTVQGYTAGTWGPSASIALIERDGRTWHESM